MDVGVVDSKGVSLLPQTPPHSFATTGIEDIVVVREAITSTLVWHLHHPLFDAPAQLYLKESICVA